MNLRDALGQAEQILAEERTEPTLRYEKSQTTPVTAVAAPYEGGQHLHKVRENPREFQFSSTNFDLLCTLADQVQEQDRPALFAQLRSRILDSRSYRHNPGPVLGQVPGPGAGRNYRSLRNSLCAVAIRNSSSGLSAKHARAPA
jgi:hypothetical protein